MRHLDQAASVTEGRFGVVVVSLALYELALLELRSGSDKGREIRGVDGPPSRTLGRRLGRPAWHLTADGGVPMLPGVVARGQPGRVPTYDVLVRQRWHRLDGRWSNRGT